MNYNNINEQLLGLLTDVATKNTTKTIRPGEDYIPVTGKVLDKDDILLGVDAMLDG
jgi:CDP-6-deoxy-D-xylo-4-hexulose-3-dehydrase